MRKTALQKPVIVYKAGKNEGVSKATATHTGSLAGEYRLYRSMFRQAGAFEAQSASDAVGGSQGPEHAAGASRSCICALTFTAAPYLVAMDKLLGAGWELPDLSSEAKAKIGSIIGEKAPVDLQNPVDLTGPGFVPNSCARP